MMGLSRHGISLCHDHPSSIFCGFPNCPWFFSRDSPPGITLELALELTRWPGNNKNNPSSPSGRSVCELKVWCNIQWSLGYSTYIYIYVYIYKYELPKLSNDHWWYFSDNWWYFTIDWFVVWNMNFIFPKDMEMSSSKLTNSYFSEG